MIQVGYRVIWVNEVQEVKAQVLRIFKEKAQILTADLEKITVPLDELEIAPLPGKKKPAPDFLCNSLDDTLPQPLHKNIDGPNFLCNSLDDVSPEVLHKNIDGPNFLCNTSQGILSKALHKIYQAIDRLSLPELKNLHQYIQAKIDAGDTLDIPVRQDREVVKTERIGGTVYQLEKVKCGKNCKKCPHGPYWYAYHRNGGRVVSKYIGKERDAV